MRSAKALSLTVALLLALGLFQVATATPRTVDVDAGDNWFDPDDVTVAVGDTVHWTNVGDEPHNVVASDGSWQSATLAPGDSFSRTFDEAGSVPYYCTFHGTPGGAGMAGTVEVTEDGPPEPAARESGRLAGPDRFATAVEISRHAFPDGAGEVYLARADAFPDALAAGALFAGPVLLVPQCAEVPEVVKAEIRRLAPERVLALGGPGAVCDAVLAEAAAS